MYSVLTSLVDRLDGRSRPQPVLDWTCPVPFFGDATTAQIATVGINPSKREFLSESGVVLRGVRQRLPTMRSLGLSRWAHSDATQLGAISQACLTYFQRQPYSAWFDVLDRVLSIAGATYYGSQPSACHLDLVPYATSVSWGRLPAGERRDIALFAADALGRVLQELSIRVVILNGRAVVHQFGLLSDAELVATPVPSWSLPRAAGKEVPGVAYQGLATRVGPVHLARPVVVLGYNHNLQSSFGVTTRVMMDIGRWVESRLS